MARDVCIDCEGDFPGGEGLKDGRCSSCAAIFEKAQPKARKAPKTAVAAEPGPEPGPEPEPEPEPEPAEGEQEEE